jgi:conjugative transfer region protein (TIGR03748 family)
MKKLTNILLLSVFISSTSCANTIIDRYTILENKATESQLNPLSVVVNVKFAKNITTVKQAIDYLLLRSGYTLDANYEADKINNFKLPAVHKSIGPISLFDAIKTLLGSSWSLQVDELSRSIQVVQAGSAALRVLSADAKTMLKNSIKKSVLEEVISVAIEGIY